MIFFLYSGESMIDDDSSAMSNGDFAHLTVLHRGTRSSQVEVQTMAQTLPHRISAGRVSRSRQIVKFSECDGRSLPSSKALD